MRSIRGRAIGLVIAVFLSVGLGSRCLAQHTFIKVADTNTIVPNDTRPFHNFGVPSHSGGDIAWLSTSPNNPSFPDGGFYAGNLAGVLTPIWLNNNSGTQGFGNPSLDAGRIGFHSSLPGQPSQGVFKTAANFGAVSTVALRLQASPAGGTFFGLFPPSIDAGRVAFLATSSAGPPAIISDFSGPLSAVVTTNTPIPAGTGNFTVLDEELSLDANGLRVAFRASGSLNQHGLYSATTGGVVSKVVDRNTVLPGAAGTAPTYGAPSAHAGLVAFAAFGSSGRGVYRASATGTGLMRIADQTTAIPGGSGNFTTFLSSEVAVHGGAVAFVGIGSGTQRGLYLKDCAKPIKIIAVGDALSGRIVSGIDIGTEALTGPTFPFTTFLPTKTVAFRANFTDGSSGVFVSQPKYRCFDFLYAAGAVAATGTFGTSGTGSITVGGDVTGHLLARDGDGSAGFGQEIFSSFGVDGAGSTDQSTLIDYHIAAPGVVVPESVGVTFDQDVFFDMLSLTGFDAADSAILTINGIPQLVTAENLEEGMFLDLGGQLVPSGSEILLGWDPLNFVGDGFGLGAIEVTPVPEPTTILLVSLGVAALSSARRRTRF